MRQWGERRRWRCRQLCGRLRPGLLDGGVAEAPPEAAGTWREAEEYVREGSVDSAGGNRHACGQEAEVEQRREQQPGPLGRRECECSPGCPGTVEWKFQVLWKLCARGGRAAVGGGKGVTPRSGKRGHAGTSNLSEGFELGLRLVASRKLAKGRIEGPKGVRGLLRSSLRGRRSVCAFAGLDGDCESEIALSLKGMLRVRDFVSQEKLVGGGCR